MIRRRLRSAATISATVRPVPMASILETTKLSIAAVVALCRISQIIFSGLDLVCLPADA